MLERAPLLVRIPDNGGIGKACALELIQESSVFDLGAQAGSLEMLEHNDTGDNAVGIHTDAVDRGDRILVIDDLLATGGTVAATARLVEELGGEVAGCGFVIELGFLEGRKAIEKYRIEALMRY